MKGGRLRHMSLARPVAPPALRTSPGKGRQRIYEDGRWISTATLMLSFSSNVVNYTLATSRTTTKSKTDIL